MEANVEIKDIIDLVTSCECCPDGNFVNVGIDIEGRSARVTRCSVIPTIIPGKEGGVAYQRVRNSQESNGWRQEDRPSIIGAHPATQCPAIYTEGGPFPDRVGLRWFGSGWNGDFPPTFDIGDGTELSVYSMPVYATDLLAEAQAEVDVLEWGSSSSGGTYGTQASTTIASIGESRIRFFLPLEEYNSGWLVVFTISVARDVFVENPTNPYRSMSRDQQRFNVQIPKEFVFSDVDENKTYSEWYIVKDLLIEAGIDLEFNPTDQEYHIVGSSFERIT